MVPGGMDGKEQAGLEAGTTLDATVQHTDPDPGDSALAKTEQTAGQNQADGVSVFVAAAAAAASALGFWKGWVRVKCLWAPSPPRSPVPVEEGTA